MTPPLYPLRFVPLFRRYLWGGRRLASELGKPIGEGSDYAESWEICDRGEDQSVVAAGPFAGATLASLVAERASELYGERPPVGRFPLLLKFLDAQQTLSVQVHPDDARAALLTPPDLGKTEAWVILAAAPGSKVYAGLKRGFDRAAIERELSRGTVELCLHTFEPQAGDCLFLPAGAVHALGAGLLVAEIQQSSDTTYRLYDWNRVGPDGKPRALHLEQGLGVVDFDLGPIGPQQPRPTERPEVERLVDCDKFVLDRWRLSGPTRIGGDGRCHVVAMLAGEAEIAGDPSAAPLAKGHSLLLPACLGPTLVSPLGPGVTLLDAWWR
ncbi:MAG: type I phosphomannose isomerase catalytic subunit [Pirellulales bacterium]